MNDMGLLMMLVVGGFIFIPLLIGGLIAYVLYYWCGMSMVCVVPVILILACLLWLFVVVAYNI